VRYVELPGQPEGAEQPLTPQLSGPAADPGEHRFGSRLRDTLDARHARQAAHTEDLRLADVATMHSVAEEGGRQAKVFLGSLLGDDWMMISGYQNSAGRIGQILVGMHGVVAMTSLHLDATVHCNGDKWRAEKFDHRTGTRIGQIDLHDQAGRSPGTWLNQAADEFEKFLRSSGAETTVLRVVLLNHPRSRVEESVRQTVNIFASPYDLGRWLDGLPKTLDRAGRRQLERLVADHS
jgi:hypothetical protein